MYGEYFVIHYINLCISLSFILPDQPCLLLHFLCLRKFRVSHKWLSINQKSIQIWFPMPIHLRQRPWRQKRNDSRFSPQEYCPPSSHCWLKFRDVMTSHSDAANYATLPSRKQKHNQSISVYIYNLCFNDYLFLSNCFITCFDGWFKSNITKCASNNTKGILMFTKDEELHSIARKFTSFPYHM